MAKVVGIGGVFLGFKGDEKELLAWYHTHLGLEVSEYGANFLTGTQIALLTFKRKNTEGVYINFRVDNIKEMMTHLLSVGCSVLQEIEAYEYGIFAQFIDPFGNPVELWEPNEEYYLTMVRDEMKQTKK